MMIAGSSAAILPLDKLFTGIAAHPEAPEYWWAYALLFSTMIPSLLNLMIGGASLMRGIPGVSALLLRSLPDEILPELDSVLIENLEQARKPNGNGNVDAIASLITSAQACLHSERPNSVAR